MDERVIYDLGDECKIVVRHGLKDGWCILRYAGGQIGVKVEGAKLETDCNGNKTIVLRLDATPSVEKK